MHPAPHPGTASAIIAPVPSVSPPLDLLYSIGDGRADPVHSSLKDDYGKHSRISAAERVYQKYGVNYLVVPTLPFGPTPEHRNYGYGYIDIPQDVYENLIYSVLKSLAQQGFKKIVIFRGCGGHHLDNTAKRFNSDFDGVSVAYLPNHPFFDVWCKHGDPNLPGGHADSFTTSLALFKRSETVRNDKIYNPYSEEPDWEDPDLDFSKYSKTGVIGDPTQATKDLGEKLWNSTVDAVADIFKEIATN
ncbi:creatininase family protein [Paenibacillus sp. CN-4]|uniref:creatininase family protein n=1 Tax=Paenibacillus nanchangensis TaxID=3348343 RepID=UPI00397D2FB4